MPVRLVFAVWTLLAVLTAAGSAADIHAVADPNPTTSTTTALTLSGDDSDPASVSYAWIVEGAPPAAVAFADPAARSTVATFGAAGTYKLACVRTGPKHDKIKQKRYKVIVEVTAVPTALGVSPDAATVAAGGSATFAATVTDQFGRLVAPAPAIAWSVSGGGAISDAGVFTAAPDASGTYLVTATAGAIVATASVQVIGGNQPPTIASGPDADPAPVTESSTTLSVLGADDAGEAFLRYSWSSIPDGANFSANGTNAAKATTATFAAAGSYEVTCTISDEPGLTVGATLTVVVAQTATAIAVDPVAVTLAPGASMPFTATVTDQFGDPIDGAAVAWSLDGPGTIDAAGVFVAGADSTTVRVQSGAASGAALVTVSGGGGGGGGGDGGVPVAPEVGIAIIAGLTGEQEGTLDGEAVFFTRSETITVAVTASPGQAGDRVSAVRVLLGDGRELPVQGGTVEVPVGEGRLELYGAAVADRGGSSRATGTSDGLILIVDRTPPVATQLIPTESRYVSFEAIPPDLPIFLNVNTPSANVTRRLNEQKLYYAKAGFTAQAIVSDAVGFAAGDHAVSAVDLAGAATGLTMIAPPAGARQANLRISGFEALADSIVFDAASLRPSTVRGGYKIRFALVDRCGNVGASDIGEIWVKTAPPLLRVGALPYQQPGLTMVGATLPNTAAAPTEVRQLPRLIASTGDTTFVGGPGSTAQLTNAPPLPATATQPVPPIAWDVPPSSQLEVRDRFGNQRTVPTFYRIVPQEFTAEPAAGDPPQQVFHAFSSHSLYPGPDGNEVWGGSRWRARERIERWQYNPIPEPDVQPLVGTWPLKLNTYNAPAATHNVQVAATSELYSHVAKQDWAWDANPINVHGVSGWSPGHGRRLAFQSVFSDKRADYWLFRMTYLRFPDGRNAIHEEYELLTFREPPALSSFRGNVGGNWANFEGVATYQTVQVKDYTGQPEDWNGHARNFVGNWLTPPVNSPRTNLPRVAPRVLKLRPLGSDAASYQATVPVIDAPAIDKVLSVSAGGSWWDDVPSSSSPVSDPNQALIPTATVDLVPGANRLNLECERTTTRTLDAVDVWDVLPTHEEQGVFTDGTRFTSPQRTITSTRTYKIVTGFNAAHLTEVQQTVVAAGSQGAIPIVGPALGIAGIFDGTTDVSGTGDDRIQVVGTRDAPGGGRELVVRVGRTVPAKMYALGFTDTVTNGGEFPRVGAVSRMEGALAVVALGYETQGAQRARAIKKSQSVPAISLGYVTPADIVIAGGYATVPISGTVSDRYAGLVAESGLRRVHVRHGGKRVGSIPLRVAAGAPSPWAPRAKSFTFAGSVQVPLWAGDHILDVETDTNEMGVTGVGQVQFRMTATATRPVMAFTWRIALDAPLDPLVPDSIRLVVPGATPWAAGTAYTLTESGVATLDFADGTGGHVVRLSEDPSLSADAPDTLGADVLVGSQVVLGATFAETAADSRTFAATALRDLDVQAPVVASYGIDVANLLPGGDGSGITVRLPEFMGGSTGAAILAPGASAGEFTGDWYGSAITATIRSGVGTDVLDAAITVIGQTVFDGAMPGGPAAYAQSRTLGDFSPIYSVVAAASVNEPLPVAEAWDPYRVVLDAPAAIAPAFMANYTFRFGGQPVALVEADGKRYVGSGGTPSLFIAPSHLRSQIAGTAPPEGIGGRPDTFTYSGFVSLGGSAGTVIPVTITVKSSAETPPASIAFEGTVTNTEDQALALWRAPVEHAVTAPTDKALVELSPPAGEYAGTLYFQEPQRQPADFVALPASNQATNNLRLAAENPKVDGGGSLAAWVARRDWDDGHVGLVWNEDDQPIMPVNAGHDGATSAPIPWLMFDGENPAPLAEGFGLRLMDVVRLKLTTFVSEPDYHAPGIDPRASQALYRKELVIQEMAYAIKDLAHLTREQAQEVLDYLALGRVGGANGQFIYYDQPEGGDGYKQWEIKKEFRNSDNTLDFHRLITLYNADKNAQNQKDLVKLREEWLEKKGRMAASVGWQFQPTPAAIYRALVYAQAITDPTILVAILSRDDSVFRPASGDITWGACLSAAAWLVVDYIPGGKLVNLGRKALAPAKAMFKRVAGAGEAALETAMRKKPKALGPVTSANAKKLCASGSCFVAGTPVLTGSGWRPIEAIVPGTAVWSVDTRTGVHSLKPVILTFTTHNQALVAVTCASPSGREAVIEGTDEHPVWSRTRHAWIGLGKLSAGEAIGADGSQGARVARVVRHRFAQAVTTYNFTVADYHTYVIGGRGGDGSCRILVHNTNNTDCYRQLMDVRRELAATGDVGAAIRNSPELMKHPPHRRMAIGADESSLRAYPRDERIIDKVPPDYVTTDKPWTGSVKVAFTQGGEEGITHFVKYSDGFPDLTPFADTAYTKLSRKGDVWVKVTGTGPDDLGSSASEISEAMTKFANEMGVSPQEMATIVREKKLTWHHHIDFRKGVDDVAEVRMVLVPSNINNPPVGGIPHMGGRSVIEFHLEKLIPLVDP